MSTFIFRCKFLKTLYWRQQKEGWGKAVASLWRMRQFYESYSSNQKLAPMVREIGWTHNVIIMEKCKDDLQREFYIRMTRKFGWTKNVLIHHVENKTYEKTLLNQTNFDKVLPEEVRNQAKLAVKLEQAILRKMEHFLREMGGLFAFVGSQYRLEVDGKEFFIDLLLYHRYMKCLVALELKIGEFKPEYIGKMQFYLRALDEQVRLKDENFSMGIILCKNKSKTIVEYTLHDVNKPIGVAEYKLFNQLPKELQKQLPAPEQIVELLDGI